LAGVGAKALARDVHHGASAVPFEAHMSYSLTGRMPQVAELSAVDLQVEFPE
jgi:hypothetical protein